MIPPFKDVILMNPDDSFQEIKKSLLTTRQTEPELATVCTFLTSPIMNPDATTIKLEETVKLSTLSGKRGRGRKGGRRDEKRYRWCDPTHENHCHRCGRTGHIAARCVIDMPPEIKEWVLRWPGGEKQPMSTPPRPLTIVGIDESDDGEVSRG